MNKRDIAATLKTLEELFPFEEGEVERLQRRKWILRYARLRGRTVGVEIGVFRGHFSEIICQILNPRRLYLVDPWTLLGERFGWGDLAYTSHDRLTTAHAKQEALTRCARFPDVETVAIETYFPVGCEAIDQPLDWAYVDADHRYAPTLGYLRALDPMMAPGGIILGDDWHPDPEHVHHGVFRAVQAFTRATKWQLIAAGPGAQWAIRRFA